MRRAELLTELRNFTTAPEIALFGLLRYTRYIVFYLLHCDLTDLSYTRQHCVLAAMLILMQSVLPAKMLFVKGAVEQLIYNLEVGASSACVYDDSAVANLRTAVCAQLARLDRVIAVVDETR